MKTVDVTNPQSPYVVSETGEMLFTPFDVVKDLARVTKTPLAKLEKNRAVSQFSQKIFDLPTDKSTEVLKQLSLALKKRDAKIEREITQAYTKLETQIQNLNKELKEIKKELKKELKKQKSSSTDLTVNTTTSNTTNTENTYLTNIFNTHNTTFNSEAGEGKSNASIHYVGWRHDPKTMTDKQAPRGVKVYEVKQMINGELVVKEYEVNPDNPTMSIEVSSNTDLSTRNKGASFPYQVIIIFILVGLILGIAPRCNK